MYAPYWVCVEEVGLGLMVTSSRWELGQLDWAFLFGGFLSRPDWREEGWNLQDHGGKLGRTIHLQNGASKGRF